MASSMRASTRPAARTCLLLAALAGLACPTARADETPLSVYLDAMSNNPGYRAAQAGRDAEHEGEAIALGALLPNVSLGGSRGRSKVDRTIADTFNDTYRYNSYQYGANIRQPIYRPYEIARYQQAGKKSELADSQLDTARADLAIKTLTAFFDAAYSGEPGRPAGRAARPPWRPKARAAEKAYASGIGSRIEISEALRGATSSWPRSWKPRTSRTMPCAPWAPTWAGRWTGWPC